MAVDDAKREAWFRANDALHRRIIRGLWQRELCPQCERHLSMCNCPDEGLWGPYDWEEKGDLDA